MKNESHLSVYIGVHPWQKTVMKQGITIGTPEGVRFNYELAGMGTRIEAYLIDFTVRTAVIVAIILFIPEDVGSLSARWYVALVMVGMFLLQWAYFVFQEAFWNGQTLGKRAVGLRVVRRSGQAISFFDAAIRNLLRVVDFLPFCYTVGLVTVFATKNEQRIGDLVAGTLVVKERNVDVGAIRGLPLHLADSAATGAPTSGGNGYAEVADKVTLTAQEYDALVSYLERRQTLLMTARTDLATKFSEVLLARAGLPARLVGGLEHCEAFLVAVAEKRLGERSEP